MLKKIAIYTWIACCPLLCMAQAVTIMQARSQATGSLVTVQGTVTNGPELGDIRYLQDGTAGIALYPGNGSAPGFSASVQTGDSISLSGYLTNYNGLLEITPVLSFQVIAKNRPLPIPKTVQLSDINESLESQLLRINCLSFTDSEGSFTGNRTYTLLDPNGDSAAVYLRNGSPIVGNLIPDKPVEITGILSQYNQYQLLPRTTADFTPASCFYLTIPPQQSGIQPSGFDLSWKTNLPSTAWVYYGTSINDPAKVLPLPIAATEHSATLSPLLPGTIYWIRVVAIHQQDTVYSEIRPFATASLSSGLIKVYFNQGIDIPAAGGLFPAGSTFSDVLAETIARINAAEKTIDVAMYNTNRTDIVNALKQAHNRGVRVRFVAAESTDNQALSPAPAFPVLYGNTAALMHDKFMVIDADLAQAAWLMGGSMNWTSANMITDFNNTLFIQDQSLARAYELEFNEMWGSDQAMPNPANSRFGSAKQDNTPHYFVVGGVPVECWFSPSDQVTQKIVKAIQTTDHQTSFAIFSFTKDEIGNAYVQAHNKGAWVRGIMENISDPGAEIGWLTTNGLPVFPHPANALLHHKYLVADAGYPASDPLVVTGSHNWTITAENSNDENTLIIHDPELAILYQAEFERRWSETTTATLASEDNGFAIFPNPASGQLFIRRASKEYWSGALEIWDAAGRLYCVQSISGAPEAELDIHTLPSGFYLLKIITDRGVSTIPFQTLPR